MVFAFKIVTFGINLCAVQSSKVGHKNLIKIECKFSIREIKFVNCFIVILFIVLIGLSYLYLRPHHK